MSGIFSSGRARPSPRFIGHRGFQPLAPGNSLPAFEYSALLGHWAVETDVRVTRDGVLVCCHDATVDHMFDGEGPLAELTWSEVSRMRIDTGARVATFADDDLRMPRFSDYLALCRARGVVPFIELKTPDAERVMTAVRAAGLDDGEVVVSAFRLEWLESARRVAPAVYIHHILSTDGHLERLAELGNAGLSLDVADPADLDESTVAHAHALGLKLCLRAADSLADLRRMVRLGLDYVPTNTMHGRYGSD